MSIDFWEGAAKHQTPDDTKRRHHCQNQTQRDMESLQFMTQRCPAWKKSPKFREPEQRYDEKGRNPVKEDRDSVISYYRTGHETPLLLIRCSCDVKVDLKFEKCAIAWNTHPVQSDPPQRYQC
jgi:hypothetical protein